MSIKKQQVNLEDVIGEAEEACWAIVVKHFPGSQSGDFDPMENLVWGVAMKRAITHWWDFNAAHLYEFKKEGE